MGRLASPLGASGCGRCQATLSWCERAAVVPSSQAFEKVSAVAFFDRARCQACIPRFDAPTLSMGGARTRNGFLLVGRRSPREQPSVVPSREEKDIAFAHGQQEGA